MRRSIRDGLPASWRPHIEPALGPAEWESLTEFVARERAAGEVFPSESNVFAALEQTAPRQVRVVLLGQDPYHGPGQAHGLSFSVPPDVKPPPSLVNVFKELEADLAIARPANGCLVRWAAQGVLLLNTVLTVRAKAAHSHRRQGWEQLTDGIIQFLASRAEPIVFLLWGRPAQRKAEFIGPPHQVLKAPHPSPLSAPGLLWKPPVLASQWTAAGRPSRRNRLEPVNSGSTASPTQFRDDALSVLDALGVEQAHLVAQSMGGWTCMRLLLDCPDRVRTVTLSGTPGGLENPAPTDSVKNLTSSTDTGGGVMATMSKATARDPVRMQLYQAINAFNTEFSMASLRGINAPEFVITAAMVAHVSQPVLFIAGAEDPLFPSALLAGYVSWFPDARIEVVEDAGHSPYFEQPSEFNRLLTQFLARGNG